MIQCSRSGCGHRAARTLILALLVVAGTIPASAQLAIESADGERSIKFGFLVQGRAEFTDTADGDDESQDLYFRRLRLLAGGKITDKLTFFMETDSPNLGKGTASGDKVSGDVYIQDFVLTYHFSNAFKLDGGLVLIPTSYNSNQSAAALLPVDYGAFSFLSSGPLTSNVGRDYGVQARGYLANDHLEYRAGVFQGRREEDSTAPFRTAMRLAWYPFEAPKGLFYPGTTHGKRKIVSLGASYDRQDDYATWAVDAFADLPVGDGDALTLQADFITYDGGDFIPDFPEQEALLLEVGYYVGSLKLSPFVQVLQRDLQPIGQADEDRFQVGVAWWPRGHTLNLKLGVGRLERDGSDDRTQVILQGQVFMF